MVQRICKVCQKEQPIENFEERPSRHRNGKTIHLRSCKRCIRERKKILARARGDYQKDYVKHRERRLKRQKAWAKEGAILLRDTYIRSQLVKKFPFLKDQVVPKDLMEVEREYLVSRRISKKIHKEMCHEKDFR